MVGRVETQKELALLLWAAAEVPKGYLRCEDRVLLKSVESQPQARLPIPEHQSQNEATT